MTAEQILVIILSSALALFLLLGIIAFVLVIKILRHLKRISEKAENIANKAEMVGEFFERGVGPLAIGRLLTNVADVIFKKSAKGNANKGDKDA